MVNVVIDLGELPHAGGKPLPPMPGTRSPRPYRTVLAVIAVTLVAVLAGAAHVGPPTPPTIVAARLGDAMFVAADRFFLVSDGPKQAGTVQNKIISAYRLPDGRLLSLTTVVVSGAIFDVASVGDTILVSYQIDSAGTEATVALTAGTGIARWRRPARLLGASVADDLVLLRENSPQFGPLYWYGVDLSSGDVRWQLEQPAGGYITGTDYAAGFPRRLIGVDTAGHLEVRDAATGAVTARTTIGVPADWVRQGIALWPDGDLVLAGDHTATTAYALPDLTARWRVTVDLYTSYIGPSCGDAVCFFSPRGDGMRVLDRATGRDRWSSERWSYADQVGPNLLAGTDGPIGADHTLTVVDTRTGRIRGDFRAWQSIGPPGADGTVVGLRQPAGEDVVWFARLDPAKLSIRLLGVADHVSGDCQTTSDVLICRRLDASVGIWRLS